MLGLYVHIPFCVSKCNYCDFNSFKLNKELKDRYIKDLKKEMILYKDEFREKRNNVYIFRWRNSKVY